MSSDVIKQVKDRIAKLKLKPTEAATQIGVTPQSLSRHLSGEYVRSDSLAKYRCWLEEMSTKAKIKSVEIVQDPLPLEVQSKRAESIGPVRLNTTGIEPERPFIVVDLFCGCGGLSLGFERQGTGHSFQTVLGIDIEEPMIRVFNDNHKTGTGKVPIGRIVDMTDFLNEAEIQAYYLRHLFLTGFASELETGFSDLNGLDLNNVIANLCQMDLDFIHDLSKIRSTSEYVEGFKELAQASIGQTSVLGFHDALRLPVTRIGKPKLTNLIWNDGHDCSFDFDALRTIELDQDLLERQRNLMLSKWEIEHRKLVERAEGQGAGQLSSSAIRISNFLDFMEMPIFVRIKDLWVEWQTKRTALRIAAFFNDGVIEGLDNLYQENYQVSVLLGGPPCQGFSRIGRGKIRSLQEQRVHVQHDDISVDHRNLLLEQYILFVSALRPSIFLFENVRHFKAEVRTPEGSFDATEVLSEAIENISNDGLNYTVSSRIVKAQNHMIPQTRERYIMVGLRDDIARERAGFNLAEWCLSLQKFEPVNLNVALEGLPEPVTINRAVEINSGKVRVAPINNTKDIHGPANVYRKWILEKNSDLMTDRHIARSHRGDDSDFFSLIAPGKRWMDYRCDSSPTLKKINKLISSLREKLSNSPKLTKELGIGSDSLKDLEKLLDGSLSIRLLLETIPLQPGEIRHHLATSTYLKKKEGNHGDWLARMDGSRPSKTIVSHMSKDSYAFIHPSKPRTLSVREAARIQSFPDDFKFCSLGLVDCFRVIGNAVPPLLSRHLADRVAQILMVSDEAEEELIHLCNDNVDEVEEAADCA